MKTQVSWLQTEAKKSVRMKFNDFSMRGNTQSLLTGTGTGAEASACATVWGFEFSRGYVIIYTLFVMGLAQRATGQNGKLPNLQPLREQEWAAGQNVCGIAGQG